MIDWEDEKGEENGGEELRSEGEKKGKKIEWDDKGIGKNIEEKRGNIEKVLKGELSKSIVDGNGEKRKEILESI